MKTKNDVIETLAFLRQDLQTNRDGWENPTLERYLEAMHAWLTSAKYREVNEPSWDIICDMLQAAKIYE